MVLLGVILVLLAAGAGVLLFIGTEQITDTVDITILGGTLSLPPLALLITGMVLITLFWLGWAMLRGGLRRGKRRRVDAKEAAAAAEARRVEDERRMQDEFAARERQLVEERRQREQETATLRAQTDTTHTDNGEAVADGRSASATDIRTADTRSADTGSADTQPSDGSDTRRV